MDGQGCRLQQGTDVCTVSWNTCIISDFAFCDGTAYQKLFKHYGPVFHLIGLYAMCIAKCKDMCMDSNQCIQIEMQSGSDCPSEYTVESSSPTSAISQVIEHRLCYSTV